METSIAINVEEMEKLRLQWEGLHKKASGNVFQSHEWLLTWWKVYGSRFRLRLFCIWHDSHLVCIFPCFVRVVHHGPFKVSVLRMMGEHEIFGEYHPLVDPVFANDLVSLACEFLAGELSTATCDLIDFHHYPASSNFINEVLLQLKHKGFVVKATTHSLEGVQLPVPPDWETYILTLSKKMRKTITRGERLLLKNGAVLERLTGEEYTEAAFDDFVSLHGRIWTTKGKRGFFREKEGFEAFHREVTAKLMKKKQAGLLFFSKEDARFAGLLTFFVNGSVLLYLSGRDPDHPLDRYSPGEVLLAASIRKAIDERYRICDLQEGTTPYKFRLGGKSNWYSRATVFRRGLRGFRGRVVHAILSLRNVMP
jgi:CelD/BcsL family acetyltransferase involved in cellulose biosynthesis